MQILLNNLTYMPSPKPGLPELVFGGGYIGRFMIEKLDGKWFAWLGFNPQDGVEPNREVASIDPDLWSPAQMSEFYLAKEAEAKA